MSRYTDLYELKNGVLTFKTPLDKLGFDEIQHCHFYEETYKYAKKIIVPEGTKKIPKKFFEGYYEIEDVFLPNGLCTISEKAFDFCANLSTVNLPNSLREIGKKAFRDCRKLKEVLIPNDVIIGKEAFLYCQNLIVHLKKAHIPTNSIGFIRYDKTTKSTAIKVGRTDSDVFDVIQFIRNPSYSELLKIKGHSSMSAKLALAIAYNDVDRRMSNYLKGISSYDILDYLFNTYDFVILDFLLEHELISKKKVDSAIETLNQYREKENIYAPLVLDNANYEEIYLLLIHCKEQLDGYSNVSKRFFL